MDFASAIEATVRGGIDIGARRSLEKSTGSTLMLRAIIITRAPFVG
jgi:hypothetical protein